jgi:hypothetical protein
MRVLGVFFAADDPSSRLQSLAWIGPIVGLVLGVLVFGAIVWVGATLIMEYVPWLPWLGVVAGIVCGFLGFLFADETLGATGFGLGLFSGLVLFLGAAGEAG